MKITFLLTLLTLPLLLSAAPAELPKEIRTAEAMIQDGLGRDAVVRLRTYLTKNSSTPQPYAQLLLSEALLGDHRDLHYPRRRQRQMCIRDRAKALSLPLLIMGTAGGIEVDAIWVCPATTALMAAAG